MTAKSVADNNSRTTGVVGGRWDRRQDMTPVLRQEQLGSTHRCDQDGRRSNDVVRRFDREDCRPGVAQPVHRSQRPRDCRDRRGPEHPGAQVVGDCGLVRGLRAAPCALPAPPSRFAQARASGPHAPEDAPSDARGPAAATRAGQSPVLVGLLRGVFGVGSFAIVAAGVLQAWASGPLLFEIITRRALSIKMERNARLWCESALECEFCLDIAFNIGLEAVVRRRT